MRYLIKVFYNQNGEQFELDYLASKFKAQGKYPKQLDQDYLKPLKQRGLFIPNKKANVLENSWEVVYMAQEIKKQFFNLLKKENEDYLYRHYGLAEGKLSNPIVEEFGKNNFYVIEIHDLFYPTYDENGKMQKSTIEKQIYSFNMDASYFLPIRNNSYRPNLKSTYRGMIVKVGNKTAEGVGVLKIAQEYIENRSFSNRFDTLNTQHIDYNQFA